MSCKGPWVRIPPPPLGGADETRPPDTTILPVGGARRPFGRGSTPPRTLPSWARSARDADVMVTVLRAPLSPWRDPALPQMSHIALTDRTGPGPSRASPVPPRHPSDRSTSPTPESPSPPAPRSLAASLAFAKSTQARHPHVPGSPRAFTTLQTSLHAADPPVDPPRFDPGLSTGPGGFSTEDLGVSSDRTSTGWLTRASARLRHDRS